MPIKFPKFARRKSAGNELEANYEPANVKSPDEPTSGSSFNVLPRGNRGSAQTNSTYSYHGSQSSSNRLSSNSTLPSTDAPITPDEFRQPHHHLPDLGNFHLHKPTLHKAYSSGSGALLEDPATTRAAPPRRSTMALAPPQLATPSLDSSSLFDEDMFEHLRPHPPSDGSNDRNGVGSITPKAPKIASNSTLNSNRSNDAPTSPTTLQVTATPYSNMFTSSQHMDSDRPTINTESSPYHWDNNNSPSDPTKALLHSDPSDNSPRNSRMLTPGQRQRPYSHGRTDSLEAPTGRPKVRRGSADAGMKRMSAVHRRQSIPMEDEDAAIVARSAHSSRGQNQNADKKERDSGWGEASSSDNSIRSNGSSKDTAFTTPLMSRGNTDPSVKKGTGPSSPSTPKVKRYELADLGSPLEVDPDISAAAALAVRYEEKGALPDIPTKKVMTRAQFERYQRQQDERRQLSGKPSDSDDDESVVSDEEESDAERNRNAQKMREKQDAHLSVYRQQMRKVTGTTQSDAVPPLQRASLSMSALPILNGTGTPLGDDSSEEDEEIPLGILMAHGFPNKTRPPTRLANSSSQPNLRAASQRDASLPVFARNLPADPYNIGAGLINPSDRMSMAFHHRPESVSGGSVYNGGAPYQPPNGRGPGGLVGRIMEAEEQKAARRGMASYTPPPDPFRVAADPFSRQQTGGHGLLGLGGNGRQSMMAPSNPIMGGTMDPNSAMQMQLQMQQQQQMQQMMVQMQFMQMQMGGQTGMMNPGMMSPGMLNPGMTPGAGMNPPMRPMSMIGTPGMMNAPGAPSIMGVPPMMPPRSAMSNNTLGVPLPQQRPMSMIDHSFGASTGPRSSYAPSVALPRTGGPGSVAGFGVQSGYTPSIAPSERSNIGLPGRYRPVSYVPPANNGARTSTLTSRINGPSRLGAVNDEDDDESGWEALNKKREEKKMHKKKKNFFGIGESDGNSAQA